MNPAGKFCTAQMLVLKYLWKGSKMTKIDRNAPCPCGSGKKYKKCCMNKDREEATQARQATSQAVAHREPPDPHLEAMNALWDKLQAAGYEEQISLFQQTLADKPELMDGEMVFEFLNAIYYKSVARDDRDRFEALAEALRERLPEVYDAEAGFILGWRITNALTAGRSGDVLVMAEAMAETAEQNIDEFFNLLDQLAYHNQLATLISATRLAWPQVKDSTKIFGIDKFAEQAVDYIVFNYLSQTPVPAGDDPALLASIAPYMTVDPDRFAQRIARLAGHMEHSWTLVDFEFAPPRPAYDWDDEDEEVIDEGRQNLSRLTLEFLGYLYHRKNIPYAKGDLARTQLYEYILRRHTGDLTPADQQPKVTRDKKRRSAARQPYHPLCPDRQTLDRFLAGLLGFINPQYYKAAATLELVPAWLRFLESRQLITSEQHQEVLADLRGLDTEFLKGVQNHSDPALREAMANWRSD